VLEPAQRAADIVGKLLENAGAVAIVAVSLGAFAFAMLFALSTYGVKAWRAWKGRNGDHIVVTDADAAPRPDTTGRFRQADQGNQGDEVTGRDIGQLEGQLKGLAAGHRALRQDLTDLTQTVATREDLRQLEERLAEKLPEAAATACIKKLVDDGIIEDRRLAPRVSTT
jgi:hypothetical protein